MRKRGGRRRAAEQEASGTEEDRAAGPGLGGGREVKPATAADKNLGKMLFRTLINQVQRAILTWLLIARRPRRRAGDDDGGEKRGGNNTKESQ